MISRRQLLGTAALLAAAPAAAGDAGHEHKFAPAIIYDESDQLVKSDYVRLALEGVQHFMRQSREVVAGLDIPTKSRRVDAVRYLAQRRHSHVIVLGATMASALEQTAPDYPEVKFALIDSALDLPNVTSVLFRDEEAGFLVGALAALAAKHHKIGFVGGMDAMPTRHALAGYVAGAKFARKETEILWDMTGATAAAFYDPLRGRELARRQFKAGADVVFAYAGGTNLGVFKAAKEMGRLAIGSDVNQNGLYPGTILTSAIKRVDIAVLRLLVDARNDDWKPGTISFGVKEDSLGAVLDESDRSLITEDMQATLRAARIAVISGRARFPAI